MRGYVPTRRRPRPPHLRETGWSWAVCLRSRVCLKPAVKARARSDRAVQDLAEQTLDVLVCDATGPLEQIPGRIAVAAYREADPARKRLWRTAELHGNIADENSVHERIASREHQLV